MANIFLFYLLSALISSAAAVPWRRSAPRVQNAQAVYFMDDQDQNSVHALKVNLDGTLTDGTVTPTGGSGASGVAAGISPFQFAGPDSIFSSGSVTIARDMLLVVNPGSDSLSLFKIDPSNPLKLTMIGRPVYTKGQFPNGIAVSERLNQACVTNIGPISGIACFRLSPIHGLTPITNLFNYQLNQTYPPLGFTNGASTGKERALLTSIAFSSDSTRLIVTQAGNPDPRANIAGHLLVYPINNGIISNRPTVSTPNKTAVLFSTLNIQNSNSVFITDPSLGTGIVDISPSGVGTLISSTTIPGFSAICWAFRSSYTGTAFSSDGRSNGVIEQDLRTSAVLNIVQGTNGNLGMIDIYGAGDKVYSLSPGLAPGTTSIVVMDVSGGPGTAKIVQNFYPKGFSVAQTRGSFAAAKGMVTYPA